MVDMQVTSWARENSSVHRYAEVGGPDLECVPDLRPGSVLKESHWRFVETWIDWCQFTAAILNQRTGRAWRARDVEMAVFRTEKLRTAIETTDRNSASVIVPVAFGISSAMCLGLTDSQVD